MRTMSVPATSENIRAEYDRQRARRVRIYSYAIRRDNKTRRGNQLELDGFVWAQCVRAYKIVRRRGLDPADARDVLWQVLFAAHLGHVDFISAPYITAGNNHG